MCLYYSSARLSFFWLPKKHTETVIKIIMIKIWININIPPPKLSLPYYKKTKMILALSRIYLTQIKSLIIRKFVRILESKHCSFLFCYIPNDNKNLTFESPNQLFLLPLYQNSPYYNCLEYLYPSRLSFLYIGWLFLITECSKV